MVVFVVKIRCFLSNKIIVDVNISLLTIYNAFKKAQKGKRNKLSSLEFEAELEKHTLLLCLQLSSQRWISGPFQSFKIYDPKVRIISAAPFRDRVVHHILVNHIEPFFEKTFIFDSYANRKGKGTHLAIERFQQYARRFDYVLKCDVRKFFPSLDHEILKREIRWRIWQPDLLWLCDAIIDGSNEQEKTLEYFPGDHLFTPHERRKGLPIGNLTSQFWANVYMTRFDHFVKEELRVKGYIRYVDDFVLFADSKAQLHTWKLAIEEYLAKIRLLLHPEKTQIYKTGNGVPFLGFNVFPYHRIVRKEKTKRYRRFLKGKLRAYLAGNIPADRLELALNAWLGHIRFGQSQRLEHQTLQMLWAASINVVEHPNGSWKILESRPGSTPSYE